MLNRPGLDMRDRPEYFKKLGFSVSSVMCVPIILEDKPIGAFLALNKIGPECVFSQFDMYCMGVVASNAAVAFRIGANALSSSPVAHDSLGQSLAGTDSGLTTAVRALIDEAYRELKADKISLFVYKGPSSLVCLVSPDICGLEVPSDAGFVGLTFKNSQAVKISNAKADSRHYSAVDEKENYNTGALLSFPVMGADGQPLGVLQAVNKKGSTEFTVADERYMADLCSNVGHIISRLERAGSELKSRKIINILGKFATCVSRVSSSANCILSELLLEAATQCKDIAECDEVKFYSLSSEELTSTESSGGDSATVTGDGTESFVLSQVDLLAAHGAEAEGTANPEARWEGVHPLILEALRRKCIMELPLDESRGEGFMPDTPAATALIVPLSTTASSISLSSMFHNPVDVMMLVRRRSSESPVLPFLPVEKEGIASFSQLLVNAIRNCALMKEQMHLKTVLNNDSALLKATLSSLKIAVFVVSSANYNIVVHTRSTEKLLGVSESDIRTLNLPTMLGDMCPVMMGDIREAMRTSSPKERKSHNLITPAFPEGILVDYSIEEDLIDYRSNVMPSGLGSHALVTDAATMSPPPVHMCRVSIRAIDDEKTVLWGDDGLSSVYHVAKELSTDADYLVSHSSPSHPRLSELSLLAKSFSATDAWELERVFDWDFNVLKMSNHDAMRLAVITIFEREISLPEINISRSQLYAYISEVDKNYRLNPFHNFYHAVSVTHFIFMLMRETGARSILKNDLLYFSMLLSAIVHDVDHPGNTNLFEIHSGSEWALLYNDTAVLEHHHCATAYQLMRKPGLDIFQHLSFSQKRDARKMIVSSILATDMDMHVTLVESMASKADGHWVIESPVDKIFYGKYILHCADLSNPVRPFYLAKEWASRVSEEFNRQGEIEKARGLPVSTFLLTPDTARLAKNEIYFSGQVVAPMWRNLAAVFHPISHLVAQIEENIESWKDLLDSLEQ
jgi:hypothetical protein